MKKLLLAIATVTFLFACNNGEKEAAVAKNSDWTTQNLKGMVQTIEETSYTPDSTGKIGEMDSCCISLENFDENGYTTTSSKKDSKGTVIEETSISRHEKGQAKEVISSKDGKTTSSFSIQVDKDGKYLGAQEMDSAGNMKFYYTGLTEDENGGVTGGQRNKADSTLDGHFTNSFKNGLQIANAFKDSSGKEVFNSKSELNDKGDVSKTTTVSVEKDSSTTTVKTFTYDSYDENGNWTQRTTYDDKGKAIKVSKRTITYFKKD